MKGNLHRSAHLGQRFQVQLETDAENMYFHRDLEPGTAAVTSGGVEVPIGSLSLLNGVATLTLSLPDGAAVGETHHWELEITDPARSKPFIFDFSREVAPAVESGGGRGERRPPAEAGQGGRTVPAALKLPPVISVRRPEWPAHQFTRESALSIKGGEEEGYDFYVNLDNVYLAAERRADPGKAGMLDARFRYGMALFGLSALHFIKVSREGDESAEDLVERLSTAFAPFLLPMIDGLADIDEAPADDQPTDDLSSGEDE